jgi:hypothetical protein
MGAGGAGATDKQGMGELSNKLHLYGSSEYGVA